MGCPQRRTMAEWEAMRTVFGTGEVLAVSDHGLEGAVALDPADLPWAALGDGEWAQRNRRINELLNPSTSPVDPPVDFA